MNDELEWSINDNDTSWREEVKSWLEAKVTVAEVETANMVDGRPFGYQHDVWMKLKRKIIEGDELWRYCSPTETWEALCGRAGYALVRGGEVIDDVLTLMN